MAEATVPIVHGNGSENGFPDPSERIREIRLENPQVGTLHGGTQDMVPIFEEHGAVVTLQIDAVLVEFRERDQVGFEVLNVQAVLEA